MDKVRVCDVEGEVKGELSLNPEVFGVHPEEHLVHSAVTAYLSNRRRSQARTKRRHDVSGGGAKPWKQKGTGRARAGSNTSPIWRRGGLAHGPDGRNYSISIPKKVLKKAICSALTSKAQDGGLLVIEELRLASPKTKDALQILKKLRLSGKILIVIEEKDENVVKSFRNIQGVRLSSPLSVNAYDVIDCQSLLFTKESLEALQNRITGNAE